MLEHLKEQVRIAEVERDQLSASKQRNSTLETEITQVKDDLAEARRCHAPVRYSKFNLYYYIPPFFFHLRRCDITIR